MLSIYNIGEITYRGEEEGDGDGLLCARHICGTENTALVLNESRGK